MKTFDSEGVSIAYLDSAPTVAAVDSVPVILVHGFASNVATNWVAPGWIDTLTGAGYRVIAIDNRGHGTSEKRHDPSMYGGPLMAEDVRRLIEHLGLAQAHVMGYSMGARITAFLTLKHPALVKSAVFAGLGINMVRGMAGTGPIANALEAPSIEDVVNPTARTFRAFAEQTKSDLQALAACIRSSRDPISRDEVGRISCPVLVAVGSEDVIGGSAEDLAELIPTAEAFVIPGRDHMKAVGDKAYKAAVLAFLERYR
ncbi:MAG: alpha/beta hydrolase [Alphaproteobacteria bacterium]|nr:alpha/beta hydrolase [Alphaproteobacteria bacterium]